MPGNNRGDVPFRFVMPAAFLLSLVCGSVSAVQTGMIKKTLPSDADQEYFLRVPGNYDAKRAYPLIVSIHGMGGSGNFINTWHPENHQTNDIRLTSDDFIFMGPSFNGDNWFDCSRSKSGERLDKMMDLTFKEYNIDRSLVFMNGFSAGGACTWTYLWKHNKDGGRITGGVFLTGANCWRHIVPVDRYDKNMPWFIEVGEGEWDLASLGQDGEAARDNLKKAGYERVEFHKILGQGHAINKESMDYIWAWMWKRLHDKELAQLKKLEDALGNAQAACQAGRPGEAIELLGPVPAIENNPLVQKARALLKKVDADLATAMKDADARLSEKKYADAFAGYAQIAEKFRGLPGAVEAQKKLDAAQGDPAIQEALRQQKLLREADLNLSAAKKFEEDKQFEKALNAYDQIASKYTETPAGKSAQAASARIRGDKELMKLIQSREADLASNQKLRTAQNYLSNNMKDEAKGLLKDIVAAYPGTKAATKAQAILAGL